MKIESYQDLIVWQKAMEYVVFCYEISAKFPASENFGLTSQLRRSAVSIPSNIAEGYGRNSRGEYIQFLGVANGSLKESETQIIVASRLKYITSEQLDEGLTRATEIGKMLRSLINSIRK
jgi:four helix bundle protein